MLNEVLYNQVIYVDNNSLNVNNVERSFLEKRKLILILENSIKIIIPGNNIDTSGNKEQINELISMAEERGLGIFDMPVKHYAKDDENEYVLLRW